MNKAIEVLNDVYGEDQRSTDVYYPLTTILEAMEVYADQFRQPDVIKSVCPKCKFEPMINVEGKYKCEMCDYDEG